ncbi:AAA family ATPase [uncultured Desulfobacter sp.]|uniref:AAA family ATPase n=1 Tax=uncultured Desulfobacter sp. TaxID=240139 RepID=UPI002AA90467|nr:AAA family ATPase [uncultured Desulfobacter sp.]
MHKRKKLPIGIQTFANLIDEGYLYVDKTPLMKFCMISAGILALGTTKQAAKGAFPN